MTKTFAIYILTNATHRVLYTGVTSDLLKRLYQHQSKDIQGFTSRYHVNKLVYYEMADNPETAIVREKALKGWTRKKKIDLIQSVNPQWNDLSETLSL